MLKRLIEVALPLKEVSEQSAREKSIRHGHISTLHIWWARRPLAACRAVVFASLIPDPDDPECPEEFQKLVGEVLGRGEFTPKDGDGDTMEDTARNRCLEFMKHLVRWENSNNADYIEPARKLIAAAHKILHPDAEGDAPKVLDPFAGGGAIPLEALRLGCEAHAIDLNPVAHLIELCTLVYPQKYGQPDSRPVPDYIKRLIAHNRTKKKGKDVTPLFDKDEGTVEVEDGEIIPDVEITEAGYRKNPLAADVKYWGQWIVTCAKHEIAEFYPLGPDASQRIAYLWANTLPCPNPRCQAAVPLVKNLLVANRRRQHYLSMTPNKDGTGVEFTVVEGSPPASLKQQATIHVGAMQCPVCHQGTYNKSEIKSAARKHGLGTQPLCVVVEHPRTGRGYQDFLASDLDAFSQAGSRLTEFVQTSHAKTSPIPDETISRDFEWVLKPPMFGLTNWGDLFNERQKLALGTLRFRAEITYTNCSCVVLTFLRQLPRHGCSSCRKSTKEVRGFGAGFG